MKKRILVLFALTCVLDLILLFFMYIFKLELLQDLKYYLLGAILIYLVANGYFLILKKIDFHENLNVTILIGTVLFSITELVLLCRLPVCIEGLIPLIFTTQICVTMINWFITERKNYKKGEHNDNK